MRAQTSSEHAARLCRAIKPQAHARLLPSLGTRLLSSTRPVAKDVEDPAVPPDNAKSGGFLGLAVGASLRIYGCRASVGHLADAQSLIYGSSKAKAEGLVAPPPGQHSKLVGRGKYVHEKITHAVVPARQDAYVAAAEKYFGAIRDRGAALGGVKLTGSWETIVGPVGDFTHVLEHGGYKGYDEHRQAAKDDPELRAALKEMLANVHTRQHQLMSEFSFWPSMPPHDSGFPGGGVFEMRSYQLQPGKLLEWEGAWRRGLEARKRFVQPVGAFFSQVGQLHEVHHIWQYPDMDTRKAKREQAWTVGSWSETVQETVKLTTSMKSAILVPCSWSPLR